MSVVNPLFSDISNFALIQSICDQGEIGRAFLRIFVVFLGVIILFTGIALTVVYLSVLIRFPVVAVMDQAGMQAFPLYALVERIFSTDTDLRAFVTGVMILAGIPLVMMIWGGIRLIFNLPRVKFLAGIAGLAWVCALIITIIFGLKVANSFRYPAEVPKETALNITGKDTLHILANRYLPEDSLWEKSGVFYLDEFRLVVSNNKDMLRGIPVIKFKPSGDSTAILNLITSAKGAFKEQAIENAEKIEYEWQQRNDTLFLSDSYVIPDNEKWRRQGVRVEVKLPAGTTVTIDEKLHPFLGYHRSITPEDRLGMYYYMNAYRDWEMANVS